RDRIHRRFCYAGFVYGFAATPGPQCATGNGPLRNVSGDGRGGDIRVSPAGERGHDDRKGTGYRHSASAHELRRVSYVVCFSIVGPGDERTHQALRQLNLQGRTFRRTSGTPPVCESSTAWHAHFKINGAA